MAAHLVLTKIATLYPNLSGKVTVYSDCKGAIYKLKYLPPVCLPEKCKHLDILKNILINCSNLPFKVELVHIEAHQNDWTDFNLLS